MVAIDDPWVAFCLDEAVFTWGAHVESEMAKAEDSVKEASQKMQARQTTLTYLLSEEPIASAQPESEIPSAPPKGRFADPAASWGKK